MGKKIGQTFLNREHKIKRPQTFTKNSSFRTALIRIEHFIFFFFSYNTNSIFYSLLICIDREKKRHRKHSIFFLL